MVTINSKKGSFEFDPSQLADDPRRLAKAFNQLTKDSSWNGKSDTLTGKIQLATLEVVLNKLEELYISQNLNLKRYAKCLIRATQLTSFDKLGKSVKLTNALNEVWSLPAPDIIKIAKIVRENILTYKKALGGLPKDGTIVTSAGSTEVLTPCNLLLLLSHMNRVPDELTSKTPSKSVPLNMDADLIPHFLQFMEGSLDKNLDDQVLLRLCACASANDLPLLSAQCGELIWERIPDGRFKISSDNVHLLLQTKKKEIIQACRAWFNSNYKNKLLLETTGWYDQDLTVKVLSASADPMILNRIIPGIKAVCFSEYSALENYVGRMKDSPTVLALKNLVFAFDKDICVTDEVTKVLTTCFPSLESLEVHSEIELDALKKVVALKSLKVLQIHNTQCWNARYLEALKMRLGHKNYGENEVLDVKFIKPTDYFESTNRLFFQEIRWSSHLTGVRCSVDNRS